MSTLREAFISTLHSDRNITIESINDEHFFFVTDHEIPVQTFLFLKDPEALEKGVKKLQKFEVIEVQKMKGSFRYYGVFVKNEFDFDEWEKKHKKK